MGYVVLRCRLSLASSFQTITVVNSFICNLSQLERENRTRSPTYFFRNDSMVRRKRTTKTTNSTFRFNTEPSFGSTTSHFCTRFSKLESGFWHKKRLIKDECGFSSGADFHWVCGARDNESVNAPSFEVCLWNNVTLCGAHFGHISIIAFYKFPIKTTLSLNNTKLFWRCILR